MKRTKNINRNAFRKALVVGGVVMALSGCEVADETVKMYQTVDQCTTLESEQISQCKDGFESAKAEHEKSAPKFESASDCAEEFGTCEYNTSSGSFMPMMTGFMIGQMMGNMQANSNLRAAQPLYSGKNGGYQDMNRRSYSGMRPGKPFQTTKSSMASKPASVKQVTSSRGGFGSSASRGSFGG